MRVVIPQDPARAKANQRSPNSSTPGTKCRFSTTTTRRTRIEDYLDAARLSTLKAELIIRRHLYFVTPPPLWALPLSVLLSQSEACLGFWVYLDTRVVVKILCNLPVRGGALFFVLDSEPARQAAHSPRARLVPLVLQGALSSRILRSLSARRRTNVCYESPITFELSL